MSHEQTTDGLNWHVAHTHPKQEDRASDNLRALGLEVFAPRVQERYYNQYTGKPTYFIKPLFPRYIFVKFSANAMRHKVYYTRGVHSLVSFSEAPCVIDEEVIALIKARVGSDGLVKICEEIKGGDEVVIKAGPLKCLEGVFERELSGKDRVVILLTAINFQARAVVERDIVQKVKKVSA